MHPAIFISATVLVGMLFALQEWMNLRRWGYSIGMPVVFESWGMQFLIWGILCWLLWRFLRPLILDASPLRLFTHVLPLSIAASVLQEMVWVLFFPNLPLNHAHMGYWQRLAFHLDAELVDSMAIFWCAFFFFRGIGYYQQFREKETTAARLEVQLVQARLAALRMQLNPHFLFNAMNSISSLMRIDVDAADSMLEQLSSLLRITLERGDVQLIALRREVEFIEIYLAMQERRYSGRVRQRLSVDSELHDALVPALILQPIVENAFVHGLSRCNGNGELAIDIRRDGKQVKLSVVNSGVGLKASASEPAPGRGVGLANIRDRLRLHYGEKGTLNMRAIDDSHVQVTVTLPLQMSANGAEETTRFGA